MCFGFWVYFLEHLLEVDDRKLFATLNCDTLEKYVIKVLGYAETTAYERIRAMRLLRRAPVLGEKLKSGELNLSTAAQVESFRRRENLGAVETIQLMKSKGIEYVIECGPGKVLSGLIKRIERTLPAVSVNDNASLEQFLSQLTADEKSY
mgnify:CR=1 FL=1